MSLGPSALPADPRVLLLQLLLVLCRHTTPPQLLVPLLVLCLLPRPLLGRRPRMQLLPQLAPLLLLVRLFVPLLLSLHRSALLLLMELLFRPTLRPYARRAFNTLIVHQRE